MKRFLQWLVERFDRKEPPKKFVPRRTGDRRRSSVPVNKNTTLPRHVKYGTTSGGKIVDGGPGKNVLVRNKYVREETGTHEKLQIVDEALSESADEDGIDPYNTGRFDRSKSWDFSRSRK